MPLSGFAPMSNSKITGVEKSDKARIKEQCFAICKYNLISDLKILYRVIISNFVDRKSIGEFIFLIYFYIIPQSIQVPLLKTY